MKTKKWISIIAAGVMVMSMLAGCKTSDTPSDRDAETQPVTAAREEIKTAETSQTAENAVETERTTEEADADSGAESESAESDALLGEKILVVYYSANGHTENVANMIADAVGADLFELEPAKPYTSEDLNYRDDNSRVSREHENEDQRKVELVSVAVEDWDAYETVFIGYPIWWEIAAWPVDSFVEENDFTGKTVIPFCTSASSDIGESRELLEKKAGTGDWQEGMRFSSNTPEDDVKDWVTELGLSR